MSNLFKENIRYKSYEEIITEAMLRLGANPNVIKAYLQQMNDFYWTHLNKVLENGKVKQFPAPWRLSVIKTELNPETNMVVGAIQQSPILDREHVKEKLEQEQTQKKSYCGISIDPERGNIQIQKSREGSISMYDVVYTFEFDEKNNRVLLTKSRYSLNKEGETQEETEQRIFNPDATEELSQMNRLVIVTSEETILMECEIHRDEQYPLIARVITTTDGNKTIKFSPIRFQELELIYDSATPIEFSTREDAIKYCEENKDKMRQELRDIPLSSEERYYVEKNVGQALQFLRRHQAEGRLSGWEIQNEETMK